ncbi:DUF5133 domain-containing protein [Streptomyces sp. SAJ15]|uniref:DUF5133 domain-containing protein n=1 Tax=Streptomyces sp. SAJ15 TaxID=2011095 RepID=UPI001186502B|nr:DUF5133 domain-containing protein [Streptomyces sp. SAJ15]TVL89577.1 DUF5133 domain-containing protein [Streptomyces sp. SAJ15]
MLMAHPTVLRELIERYEALQDLPHSPQVRQRTADVVYTLCVSTGTRTAGAALATARDQLRRASVREVGPRSLAKESDAGCAGESPRPARAVGIEPAICTRPE